MKTNEKGRECPAWCVTDHEAGPYRSCKGPEHGTGPAKALADQPCYEDQPKVTLWVYGANGFHAIYADDPQQGAWLAEALESLAAMTKPQIRALAADVRVASTEAWPEEEAEAG